jgi:hypothetical protein
VNSKVKALAKRGFDPQKPSKPIGRLIVHGYDRLAAFERISDSQIRTVSPAPGDEATAALWLQKRASFTKLLQRGGHLFAHQKQRKSLRLFLRALKTQDEAATIIDQFGFQYCVRILPGT